MEDERDMTAVIFANSASLESLILTEATLRLSRRTSGFRVLALCDTAESSPLLPRPIALFANQIRRVFDPASRLPLKREMMWSLRSLARHYSIDLIVPPGRNINEPGFVRYLKQHLKPVLALSYRCPQIFGKSLLGAFGTAVNNHGGTLPTYRGMSCLEWSIYNGEYETGFSYHYMTAGIDEGPLLLTGEIPIDHRSLMELRYDKAKLAATQLETVLKAVAARDPGTEQVGESCYYSRAAAHRIRTIRQPFCITWEELRRRLRAFGSLVIEINGEAMEVTNLHCLGLDQPLRGSRSFVTAEGITVVATRFASLPYGLYCLMRRWRNLVLARR